MMKTYWVILWSLWAARLVRQPTVPVRVTGGWLRGDVAHDGSHKKYLSVPFATHPAKRFLAPGPEPTWLGMFEAIEEHIRCLQRIGASWLVGQEECLILNIYTPMDATPTSKYPVMVYIHEGGFYEGSNTRVVHGPHYLVSKGVILVAINYRLTTQGFTCLRIKEAPGNAGMKDQVAALKWIKRNIKEFGGDPNSVTLIGISAGATSISFHMLSPMSKGLYHKTILQSGSSLAPWSLQFSPIFIASLLTKVMGYTTEDPYELYEILMNKSDRDLIVTRVPRRENNVIISELLHTPCVEHEIEGEEPFLTDLPYNLLSKGEYNKVPTMIGVTNEEGLLFVDMENETTIPNIIFEKSIPKNLHAPLEIRKEIGKKLMKFYMDDKNISIQHSVNLSRFHGELYFTYPALEETELLLDSNGYPVYSYIFSYDGWRNFLKITLSFGLNKIKGATHADDIFYVFDQLFIPNFFENKMIDRVTTMWTNFAKYGDPTPQTSDLLPVKWLPTNKSSPHSFVIDEEFSYSPLWTSDSLKYLREVYAKYRRKGD